jgi:hypothetical protein
VTLKISLLSLPTIRMLGKPTAALLEEECQAQLLGTRQLKETFTILWPRRAA